MTNEPIPKLMEKMKLVGQIGDDVLSVEEKLHLTQALRASRQVSDHMIDEFLIKENERLNKAILETKGNLDKLKKLHKKLTAPPWHQGIFLRPVETIEGPRAQVSYGNSCRILGVAEDVDWKTLTPGEEVFLTSELNLIVGKSPYGISRCGETGFFDRYTGDGRMILKWRDDEVVLDTSAALEKVELKAGDEVRWNREIWMAFEKIDRDDGRQFLLNEMPDVTSEKVGGQDGNLAAILSALTTTLIDPQRAVQYGLQGRVGLLMVGPPGCGKTLMARVAASEVTRLGHKRCHFGVVKPGEWLSPWVGTTEANIRSCFEALREVAMEFPAVLFLDEIEAIGSIRGGLSGHHSDKFLATLLAEMDGFSDRGNVAIIAATNRKDLVDPALLERISDTEVRVNRPDAKGAQAIFAIHLPETLPYSPNGTGDETEATRREIIDTAVSLFYSPNGDSEICKLRFRDGKTRIVASRELASGRIFEQICRAACQSAFLRSVHGGDPGLCVADIHTAVSNALDRLRTTLSPNNAHAYLHDLPQDMDVVNVEPITPKVKQKYNFISL